MSNRNSDICCLTENGGSPRTGRDELKKQAKAKERREVGKQVKEELEG